MVLHMSKRKSPHYKIDRRLGCNLWGRPKSPYNNREYGPGEHGQRRKKASDYGVQLAAKQKLKGYYGNISERQFRKYYQEAVRQPGDTSEKLIGLLERRLDAFIYRINLAPTVFSARQIINHGHIEVNSKRVNIPSYLLKQGDTVTLSAKSQEHPLILESIQEPEREIPEYLEVDYDKIRGKLLRIPELADVPYPVQMEPNLVVEFYSR